MPGYATTLVKVYLLDDHDIVRRGLRDLLAAARDIQVVGDSGFARGAAQAILDLEATVMVLDLQLQDGTGIEVCRAVRAVDPAVHALLLTSSDEDEALAAAILAGADGYIVKQSRGADIIGAVRRLGGGRSLIEPTLAEPVARQLAEQHRVPPLSERDQALLELVLEGLTDREIADRLGEDADTTGARVAALVAQVTGFAPAHGAGEPGRHRRS